MRYLASLMFVLLLTGITYADSKDQRLDLYFIDVEGGAANLIVTPTGESVLIDSGTFDPAGRDLNRILAVIREVAHLERIDHAVVTHWHSDHFGNHAPIASNIKIGQFWDRGIPDQLEEDPKFAENVAPYRAASQNQSKVVKPGDKLPIKSGATPISFTVLTASGDVVSNTGSANPYAKEHRPQPEDTTDNAKSISMLLNFGPFKYLCCGDLTWNTEARLMTPNNPVGVVDLFMVTHHGLNVSNNPVMVLAIDPRVCVTCNGPTKGAHEDTIATLKRISSLQAMYQLHRNVNLKDDQQAPAEQIANSAVTANCHGNWIKASVAPDGKSFTIQIAAAGKARQFATR